MAVLPPPPTSNFQLPPPTPPSTPETSPPPALPPHPSHDTPPAKMPVSVPPPFQLPTSEAAVEEFTAGSIRNVNPTGNGVNCVNCSIATELTLRGAPASALPTAGPLPIGLITKEFGGSFQPVSGPMQIGSILSQSGEGASGVVFGRGTGMNHVWNAVNQNGTIIFLDGQTGGLGVQNFDNFHSFQFLLTSPGR